MTRNALAVLVALAFCGFAGPAFAQKADCPSNDTPVGLWRFEFTDNSHEDWLLEADGVAVGAIRADGTTQEHGTWTQSGQGVTIQFVNNVTGAPASMALAYRADQLSGHYAASAYQGDIVGQRRN
jgi:hypothetical protein